MKTQNFSRLGFQVGASVGTLVFLLIGLLPAAYLSGFYGSKISEYLFGNAQALMVGLVMVFGVALAGALYLSGFGLIGWLSGRVIAMARLPKTEKAPVRVSTVRTASDGPREATFAVEHGN